MVVVEEERSGELFVLFCAAAGLFVGRLRVPDQLDPPARAGADAHGTLLPPHLRGLLYCLLPGHHPVHADLLRGLPGEPWAECSFQLLLFLSSSSWIDSSWILVRRVRLTHGLNLGLALMLLK